MSRAFLTAVLILVCAAPAGAKTLAIGSDPCPVAADAEPHVPDPSIIARDENPWRDAALGAPVTFDARLDRRDDRQDGRLFRRFFIDPETGAVFGLEPAGAPCASAVGASPRP